MLPSMSDHCGFQHHLHFELKIVKPLNIASGVFSNVVVFAYIPKPHCWIGPNFESKLLRAFAKCKVFSQVPWLSIIFTNQWQKEWDWGLLNSVLQTGCLKSRVEPSRCCDVGRLSDRINHAETRSKGRMTEE